MREEDPTQNIWRRCYGWGCVTFIMLVALMVVVCWRGYQHSSQTVTLTDLSKEHEISVRASLHPFLTGALHVVYEGCLDADASLEITHDSGRKEVISLQAGEVSGIYGSAEAWEPNLSVRFVPGGAIHGTLKIMAVCGRTFTGEEREWCHRLHMKEFNARTQGTQR